MTFTSTATDPDGSIASQAWDLDNDGAFDDATGASAQRAFSTAGSKTVHLQVTDDDGGTDVESMTFDVAAPDPGAPPPVNVPPEVDFTFSPPAPNAGQTVTFTSTSSDADGQITAFAWDLDNDGAFDDGAGATAQRAYPAGSHTVRLRVADDAGDSGTAAHTVVVAALPAVPSVAELVAKALGVSKVVPVPGFNLGGAARVFAPTASSTLLFGAKPLAFAGIGGCPAACTVNASYTLILGAAKASAAPKPIKLRGQRFNLGPGKVGVMKVGLTKKQRARVAEGTQAQAEGRAEGRGPEERLGDQDLPGEGQEEGLA